MTTIEAFNEVQNRFWILIETVMMKKYGILQLGKKKIQNLKPKFVKPRTKK